MQASVSVHTGAECPLLQVLLYCVSQTRNNLSSVLRVTEVSVFEGLYRGERKLSGICVSTRFNASVCQLEVSINRGSTVAIHAVAFMSYNLLFYFFIFFFVLEMEEAKPRIKFGT